MHTSLIMALTISLYSQITSDLNSQTHPLSQSNQSAPQQPYQSTHPMDPNPHNKQNILSNPLPPDPKKTRISFKQFQQHYEDQLVTQKQKKKCQQDNLRKLAVNNVKPLQSNINNHSNNGSKERSTIGVIDLTKPHQSLTTCNSKKSIESLKLSEINSLNSSMAFNHSNFVSPKASVEKFLKSTAVNMASNKSCKSKSFLQGVESIQSKCLQSKLNHDYSNNVSRQKTLSSNHTKKNSVININCKPSIPKDHHKIGTKPTDSKPILHQTQHDFHKTTKNPSFSKINYSDAYDADENENQNGFSSVPTQKLLVSLEQRNENIDVGSATMQKQQQETSMYLNFLISELNFVNQVFKELQGSGDSGDYQIKAHQERVLQFSYKSKLLGQIRSKLEKQKHIFSSSVSSNENLLTHSLHQSILQLLQNYENDLKFRQSTHQISNPPIQPPKSSISKQHLSIKIDNDTNPSYPQIQPRFNPHHPQPHSSKKQTVKLTKSRRTHCQEETLNSQSKVHPFETSEFSLLINTSKITEGERPSTFSHISHNNGREHEKQDVGRCYDQIESVIDGMRCADGEKYQKKLSKESREEVEVEEQRPKYQSQNKMKIHLRGSSKGSIDINKANLITHDNAKINNAFEQTTPKFESLNVDDASEDNRKKKKSAMKTINLISMNGHCNTNNIQQSAQPTSINNKKFFSTTTTTNQPQKHPRVPKNPTKQSTEPTVNIPPHPHKPPKYPQQSYNTYLLPFPSQQSNQPMIHPRNSPHNESIYQLQYLQNYSSPFHNNLASSGMMLESRGTSENQFLTMSKRQEVSRNGQGVVGGDCQQQKYSMELFR